jgi:tRNA (guanine26-N2/guanine27-N2)-dimethyltransferase
MLKMNSALLNAGYQVSQTHCNSNGFKTDAPISFLWDILREWAKEHPIKLSKYPEGSPSVQIMSKPCGSVVSFEAHPKANPQSRLAKMTRFEDHKGLQWGPKARAKRRYLFLEISSYMLVSSVHRRQSDEHAC